MGVLFKKWLQGGYDFMDGLCEFGLMWVVFLYMVEE